MSAVFEDNAPLPTSLRREEFTAVILAGYGTGLQPLTNELARGNSSSPTPKALLPIGNKPMILYPLLWLQDAGVKDVLVVAPQSHRADLSGTIWPPDDSAHSLSSLKIRLETLDDSESASLGTADILRKFKSSFETDILVLPCDFIPPPKLSLSSFLNDYRSDVNRPLVKTLLYERGEPTKDGPSPTLFGIDKKTRSMVFIDEDQGSDEDLELRLSLLRRFPNVHLTSRYLDSHVYIVKHAVLDLLSSRATLASLRDDILPWLCKLSYRQTHQKEWGARLDLEDDPQLLALAHSTTPFPTTGTTDIIRSRSYPPEPEPVQSPNPGSSSATPPRAPVRSDTMASITPAAATMELVDTSRLSVGVTLHPLRDGYAARANTIGAFVELNRQAIQAAAAQAPPVEKGPPPPGQPQISPDSIVAPSTRVGERTSIKKSVIGPHCVIGKNVKISGCIIMDHVEVKDGAKLENSILSRNTVVEEKAQLKDCELAPGYMTQPDVSLKGERLSTW